MSDNSVPRALRSSAGFVLVEAPGGCGKTFQGAAYASDAAAEIDGGRAWARWTTNGYALLAARMAEFLHSTSIVARALSRRYPIVICDEHQDLDAIAVVP
jgi:hypothetical protein